MSKQFTLIPDKDYDKTLEASVLGVFLLEPTSFGSVFNMLSEDCFFVGDHLQVYKFLVKTFNKGLPVDLLTVSRAMYEENIREMDNVNTGAFLTRLTFNVTGSAHLETWCLLLRELGAKRELIAISNGGYSGDDVLEGAARIEARLKKVLDVRVSDDWKHISQIGKNVSKVLESQKSNELTGVTTTFALVDRVNGGFKEGQMIVIGARPAVGKSALMGGMVAGVAEKGRKVGVMSLEMPSEDNLRRMMSADSKIEFNKIDRNDLYDEIERSAVYRSLDKLGAMPIYFSDTAQVNIHDIRAKAEKLKRKHGLDILFIDYLQLVESQVAHNKNREQEVSQISRGIKLLAMSLKIPIVVLAQLNRDAVDKEPELHHLRESGSMEQDADIVMFIHRAKEETGMSEESKLLIRKWRNGAPMEVHLRFESETMRFYDPYDVKTEWKQGEPENPRAGIPTRLPYKEPPF